MSYGEMLYGRSQESLTDIPTPDLVSLISVKTQQAISLKGLAQRLEEGRALNVKFGTDPTGPDLHLGHVVPIRMLDLFSRAGHNIDLIFGDFTAKVGDPTDRGDSRVTLTDEEIARNMTTFQDQVDRYFDTSRENVRVHTNSTWLGSMSLANVFGYLQSINLTEATQRNDFRERMNRGQPVSLAETIYGTLMGIDSVHLATDVEVGGVDQLLNFQQTRTVQRSSGQRAEEILMTPIIEGTSGDGRKMSKSYGNYVAVRADPDEVFGKIMSIPDRLILPYYKAFAPLYEQEVSALTQDIERDPLELKKQLATYMASTSARDMAKGLEARETFERRFASRQIDAADATPLISTGGALESTLLGSGAFKSLGEIRRLAQQGGIKVDGTPIGIDNLKAAGTENQIITVGKRRVYILQPQPPES